MELWENEVYRFKTIGQLKVNLSGSNLSKNMLLQILLLIKSCWLGDNTVSTFIPGKFSCVHY